MAARRIMTLHGRRLREELLALRQSRELKLADVVELAENDFTDTTLSRWETGENLPKPTDLRRLLEVYEAPAERKRELLALLKDARENRRNSLAPFRKSLKRGFADYLSLERDAVHIRAVETTVVPGLIQTREYAAAVTAASAVIESPADADQVVALRVNRQSRLTDAENQLEYTAILDEAVIRRQVGGSAVMADQLAHLGELGQRPNVSIRLVPFQSGAHASLTGTFSLMDFAEPFPTVVYVEDTTRGLVSDHEEDVRTYEAIWHSVTKTATNTRKSAELIYEAANQQRKDHS